MLPKLMRCTGQQAQCKHQRAKSCAHVRNLYRFGFLLVWLVQTGADRPRLEQFPQDIIRPLFFSKRFPVYLPECLRVYQILILNSRP